MRKIDCSVFNEKQTKCSFHHTPPPFLTGMLVKSVVNECRWLLKMEKETDCRVIIGVIVVSTGKTF